VLGEFMSTTMTIEEADEVIKSLTSMLIAARTERDRLQRELTWQPIRTAPTDGTWFLCHQAGDDGVIRISSARWFEGELGGTSWAYASFAMPQHWMPISERFAE
jgi:hypothetical protein